MHDPRHPLIPAYSRGTERLVAPRETLDRVAPLLAECGITRCADVTQLDNLGVPLFCAIRPDSMVQQISNGKGLTRDGAKASALMEAIELYHAELAPSTGLIRASTSELIETGRTHLHPADIEGFDRQAYFTDARRIEWLQGENLLTGEPTLVPAGTTLFQRPDGLHLSSTNGLASGNHTVEATLHALYELIERDAYSRLLSRRMSPEAGGCQSIDLSTLSSPPETA